MKIVRDGEPLALPKSRKTLALLAYLAATGRRYRRERLCSLLWELPDDPRAALRWSLSKVRAMVDDPEHKRIVADRDSVALEQDETYIDILTVREACAMGVDDLPTARLQELAEAWRGEFLEGLELSDCRDFTAWCVAERDDSRALQTKILRALVERFAGEPEAALPYARALASVAPDGDDVHFLVETLRAGSSDVGALSPPPDKPSIAVMAFDNLSDDPDQEYFADGIADDIITGLSRSRRFFVIARNSAFAFKGASVDTRQVARELGVQYVVEGSVRRIANRVRITAQLIDAPADTHVWAERYDRELADVFAVQDDITQNIITSITPEYLSAEMNRARRQRAPNFDTWNLFMRAYWHFHQYTHGSHAEAKRLCHEASALDPEASGPLALLSIMHAIEALYAWGDSRAESLRLAHEEAQNAVGADDHDTMALRALGLANLFSRRHDDAIHNFERAIDLNPNESDNDALLGFALGLAGEYEAALDHLTTALRISPRDPLLWNYHNHMAMAAAVASRDEEAIEWARKAVQGNPRFAGGHRTLAARFAHLGRTDDARAALEKLREILPDLNIAQARENLPIKHEADLERYLDGLRKAGLPE
jgi:TolB-like protein/Tfp pilus assembly protein PilF